MVAGRGLVPVAVADRVALVIIRSGNHSAQAQPNLSAHPSVSRRLSPLRFSCRATETRFSIQANNSEYACSVMARAAGFFTRRSAVIA